MKPWQTYAARHADIDVLSDRMIRVHNSMRGAGDVWYDDLVIAHPGGGYKVYTYRQDNGQLVDVASEPDIRSYLGY